eukprot:1161107-Pelagomonas_calceolata.AAC.3
MHDLPHGRLSSDPQWAVGCSKDACLAMSCKLEACISSADLDNRAGCHIRVHVCIDDDEGNKWVA